MDLTDARVRPADRSAHCPMCVPGAGAHLCPTATTLTIGEAMREVIGLPPSWWSGVLDALGLDPATPLNGPLVVLHPQMRDDLREAARYIAERSYCIGKPGGVRSELLAGRLNDLADS